MKPFFFFLFSFLKEKGVGKKLIYFALISYKNVKTQRHGLFVFSGSFLGTYCHQSGLLGAAYRSSG